MIPKIIPWTIRCPKIILELCKFKQTKNNCAFQEEFNKIKENNPRYTSIFTNGYKHGNTTGCVPISQRKISTKCLLDETSIFNAEACDIDPALSIISTNKNKNFIIFSDSLSVPTNLK